MKKKIIFILVGLILILSMSVAFFDYEEKKRTYLKCGDKFYAISKYYVYGVWDDVEQRFIQKLEIFSQNKTYIIVRFNFVRDSDMQAHKRGDALILTKGEYHFNRIEGNVSLFHNDVPQGTVDCSKANKRDLPVKKVKQKF